MRSAPLASTGLTCTTQEANLQATRAESTCSVFSLIQWSNRLVFTSLLLQKTSRTGRVWLRSRTPRPSRFLIRQDFMNREFWACLWDKRVGFLIASCKYGILSLTCSHIYQSTGFSASCCIPVDCIIISCSCIRLCLISVADCATDSQWRIIFNVQSLRRTSFFFIV